MIEYKLERHNRIEKTKPRRAKYWCPSCDRCLVRPGQRCPICGNRSSKHSKK